MHKNKNFSTILAMAIAIVLCSAFAGTTALASPVTRDIPDGAFLMVDLNANTYWAYGSYRALPEGMPKPYIDEYGNTLIPLRFLEVMSVVDTIEWDDSIMSISFMNYDEFFFMIIGSPHYEIDDGISLGLYTFKDAANNNVSPRLIDSRTYLPLRAVMEQMLGFRVDFLNGAIYVFESYDPDAARVPATDRERDAYFGF